MSDSDPIEVDKVGDEIYFWVDPCGVLMLKAASTHGDPVEVTEAELEELISKLLLSLERLR